MPLLHLASVLSLLFALDTPIKDPIPGGGVCEGCIFDAELSNSPGPTPPPTPLLKMCVRKGAKYLNRSPSPADDLSLLGLLTDTTGKTEWSAELQVTSKPGTVEWSPLCSAGNCVATLLGGHKWMQKTDGEPNDGEVVTVAIDKSHANTSASLLRIVFTKIDGIKLGAGAPGELPTIESPPPDKAENFDDILSCKVPKAKPSDAKNDFIKSDRSMSSTVYLAYSSQDGGLRTCSGRKIARDAVLTAAHCFDEVTQPAKLAALAKDLTVLVNVANAYTTLPNAIKAIEIVKHPNYHTNSLANDLAIVKLSVTDTAAYNPEFVLGEPTNTTCADALSWGYGVRPDAMQWDEPPYYDTGVRHMKFFKDQSKAECKPDDMQIQCASPAFIPLASGSHQWCHGDSGGAVYKDCGGQRYLVGIAAARVDKFLPKNPLVIASLASKQTQPSRYVPTKSSQMMMKTDPGPPLWFSQGNRCGKQDKAIGFIATRLTPPLVVWIGEVLAQPPKGPKSRAPTK